MRYSILFSTLIVILFSCNKNKFNTVPSLIITSVNTSVVHPGENLIFKLAFTDAEGDLLGDSALFVQEKVLNCNKPGSGFKAPYRLPTFSTTKNQEGELIVSFGYNNSYGQALSAPKCFKNDTAVFRFALRDQAKHVSDTIVSDKIVITL